MVGVYYCRTYQYEAVNVEDRRSWRTCAMRYDEMGIPCLAFLA